MKSWRCVKGINFWAWFEGWVFSIAFVPIVFVDDNALCMALNYVHCPALPLPCLSVCCRNEMDLDQVPSLWWNNLCGCAVESYVGNLGELINIHLIALSSKRLHLNWKRSSGIPERYQTQVEAYCMLLNWVILSPETWLSIFWQKKLSTVFVEINLCMTVFVLSYSIGWNLTFLVCWKGT